MKKLLTLSLLFASTSAFAQHDGRDMNEMNVDPVHHHMRGLFGDYSMTKEGSGTSWVPESSRMDGIHFTKKNWEFMFHGYANGVYDDQGGPRGAEDWYSTNMLTAYAIYRWEKSSFCFRKMYTLEPLMGEEGYPLLLQTGETANGVDPLIDRQHPHSFFMEFGLTYSYEFSKEKSFFIYGGYPGEPALGPPAFMHRFSSIYIPEAPITHHWLDSTHVVYGVITPGYIVGPWKFDASIFTGQEPDQHHWNLQDMDLNSYSARVTYNPTSDWSMQVSGGYISSPEQLEPDVDQFRLTASAMYNHKDWQTTFAIGRKDESPGDTSYAVLLESTIQLLKSHTIFGRGEFAQKDELFDSGPLVGQQFNVSKFSLGYFYEMTFPFFLKAGMGALGSFHILPSSLDDDYGDHPMSFMVFARMALYHPMKH